MRVLPLLLLLVFAGCADFEAEPADFDSTIIATTTQAADLARNATGQGVRSLIPPGADPHEHELRPGDLEALAAADFVIRSGGEIDDWLDEAIESAGAEPQVVNLLEAVGGDDPHWWHDPRAAAEAVAAIARGTGASTERSGRYAERIRALDAAIARCMERVPERRRRLVTTHDAFGRFAERYAIEVVGTVIPSNSTQAQASSGDVAKLVKDIRAAGVRTVFTETSVSPKVEQAIAEQAGARLGAPLFADSLGDETYLSATAKNAQAIVAGFTDGKAKCSLPS